MYGCTQDKHKVIKIHTTNSKKPAVGEFNLMLQIMTHPNRLVKLMEYWTILSITLIHWYKTYIPVQVMISTILHAQLYNKNNPPAFEHMLQIKLHCNNSTYGLLQSDVAKDCKIKLSIHIIHFLAYTSLLWCCGLVTVSIYGHCTGQRVLAKTPS